MPTSMKTTPTFLARFRKSAPNEMLLLDGPIIRDHAVSDCGQVGGDFKKLQLGGFAGVACNHSALMAAIAAR